MTVTGGGGAGGGSGRSGGKGEEVKNEGHAKTLQPCDTTMLSALSTIVRRWQVVYRDCNKKSVRYIEFER